MEDFSQVLPKLLSLSELSGNNSILFSFQFNSLGVRGVFFGASKTLTIGIADRSVAWQCDISNGSLSEKVPRESYGIIGESLTDKDGVRSNKPFFLKLKNVLDNLSTADEPSNGDIIGIIKNCKTRDKKYDEQGEKAFFDHWRRVKPSADSLNKIQRYFGQEVRQECYQNQVTAVWSTEPKEKSLIFLNPVIAKEEIGNA